MDKADRKWRFHTSELEESEPERQEMYEVMNAYLTERMENAEEAVFDFEQGKLDLTRLRQIAYLLTKNYSQFHKYLKQFMLMYRENRDARFRETRSNEPPLINLVDNMDQTMMAVNEMYTTKYGREPGAEFWRDEWVKWETGRWREYARMQGKELRQAQRENDFRPEMMPDYIPQEFGQPRDIYDAEMELRKWRRSFPRRGEAKDNSRLRPAFQLRR
jgi:sulfur relay (sulfurtransferase) DsrF/TusC family protein